MTGACDDLVRRYVRDLRRELRSTPGAGRREVVQEIEEHIAAARAELPGETEAGVRTILDRLGDPAEIAAAANERFGAAPRGSGWREFAALVLLPFGGLVVPFVGWFAGLFLLWHSDAWTSREKLVGTLVWPFGLVLPAGLFVFAGSGSSCAGGPGTTCARGGANVAWVVLALAAVLAPFLSMGYLALRLRRP